MLTLILPLLLITTINCCEYNPSTDETKCYNLEFKRGDTLSLKKYGNKLDLSLIRGPIYSESFPLLPGIKEMTIRSSNISNIESEFFSKFPNLETLMIKINHGFPNLTTQVFNNCCQRLLSLKIYDNLFKTIDNKIFQQMNSLEYLWIEKQYLGPLKPNYFNGLVNLKRLKLINCQINEIDTNAFDTLRKLTKLELQTNLIEKIRQGTFKNLNKVEELQLAGNFIKNITEGDFNGLINLKRVDFSGNKISLFSIDDFLENLPKLERIIMKFNGMDCERAKIIITKMQERNVDIKNIIDVNVSKCKRKN